MPTVTATIILSETVAAADAQTLAQIITWIQNNITTKLPTGVSATVTLGPVSM
jgi:hypothetical protein